MSTRVITPVKDERRERFHVALAGLRDLNKKKAEIQKNQRHNKCWERALEITVILRLMLQIRGLKLVTTREKKCRCCGLCISKKVADIHALPKEGFPTIQARAFNERYVKKFALEEFLA